MGRGGPTRYQYEVVIAGGGASGMVAAIFAAKNGRDVAILEADCMLGRKLLATGNGKCNFTNEVQQRDCYRGGCPDAAMGLLKRYGVPEILHFFEKLGILPKQRNGYWYPNSGQAASVRDVLEAEVRKCGVDVYTDCRLVRAAGWGDKFHLEAASYDRVGPGVPGFPAGRKGTPGKMPGKLPAEPRQAVFETEYLVLAMGGMAGSRGADGSGYRIARGFGHTIIQPVPALVQLKAEGDFLKSLAGTRAEAAALLLAGGIKYREQGEFLFTVDGISGIPAMQLSRHASVLLNRAGNPGKIELFLDFFPGTAENVLKKDLRQRFRDFPERTAEKALSGLLPSKLNRVLLERAGIAADGTGAMPGETRLGGLAALMKGFPLRIIGTNPFGNAQATAGGVSMDELHHGTMESKKAGRLYITGELADMDGTCGGYNLQWAWMTGMAAAEGIGRRGNK